MCDCPLCRPRTPINPLQWNENVKAYEYQRFPGYEIMCCAHPAACLQDGVCGWCEDVALLEEIRSKAWEVMFVINTSKWPITVAQSRPIEELHILLDKSRNYDNGVADG